MNQTRSTLSKILGIIFLDQTAITITFPLLALIFFDPESRLFAPDTDYATRSMWYGCCVALPNMINMVGAPLLSTLSDQVGRKKILCIEVLSAGFFTLIVGLGVYFGSLTTVFLGFLLKGIFVRTNPTALAIIGETSPKEKKVLHMGYLQFAISVGAFLGPLLGGYLAKHYFSIDLNFSFAFFIAALLAFLNSLITVFFMHETLEKRPQQPPLSFQAIKAVFTHPDVLRISLILLLIQISWSTYYQFMPPLLKTFYAFDAEQLGWFIGLIAFWLALATSVILRPLYHFVEPHRLLILSLYLLLVGLILNILGLLHIIPGEKMLWMAAFPVAAGDVLAYSCLTALYSDAVSKEEQGRVMGVGFIVASFVWAMTSFLGGFLSALSPTLPLILAPSGVCCALFFLQKKSSARNRQ